MSVEHVQWSVVAAISCGTWSCHHRQAQLAYGVLKSSSGGCWQAHLFVQRWLHVLLSVEAPLALEVTNLCWTKRCGVISRARAV
jgi:hypothetical protein